jgi:hypothetical protein
MGRNSPSAWSANTRIAISRSAEKTLVQANRANTQTPIGANGEADFGHGMHLPNIAVFPFEVMPLADIVFR